MLRRCDKSSHDVGTGTPHTVICMLKTPGQQTICLGPLPNGLHTHQGFQRLFLHVFKIRRELYLRLGIRIESSGWENGTGIAGRIQRVNEICL